MLSDSQPVRSCLSLALDCDDKRIETIEGLSNDPAMQALQHAFIAAGAFQCGFCTPGMLVAAFALLTSNQRPSEIDIRRLVGNPAAAAAENRRGRAQRRRGLGWKVVA